MRKQQQTNRRDPSLIEPALKNQQLYIYNIYSDKYFEGKKKWQRNRSLFTLENIIRRYLNRDPNKIRELDNALPRRRVFQAKGTMCQDPEVRASLSCLVNKEVRRLQQSEELGVGRSWGHEKSMTVWLILLLASLWSP